MLRLEGAHTYDAVPEAPFLICLGFSANEANGKKAHFPLPALMKNEGDVYGSNNGTTGSHCHRSVVVTL